MKLATIGYEGLQIDKFFELLITNEIDVLIDVRELPLSRKPGFSKTALRMNASYHGLEYIHMSNLGCPRSIRHDYRSDNNWEIYTRRFLQYLETQNEEIKKLLNLLAGRSGCILCYEADPTRCHRCYVAKAAVEAADTQLEVIHLATKGTHVAAHQLSVGKLILQ